MRSGETEGFSIGFLKEWNKAKKIIGERYRKIWMKLQLTSRAENPVYKRNIRR